MTTSISARSRHRGPGDESAEHSRAPVIGALYLGEQARGGVVDLLAEPGDTLVTRMAVISMAVTGLLVTGLLVTGFLVTTVVGHQTAAEFAGVRRLVGDL